MGRLRAMVEDLRECPKMDWIGIIFDGVFGVFILVRLDRVSDAICILPWL